MASAINLVYYRHLEKSHENQEALKNLTQSPTKRLSNESKANQSKIDFWQKSAILD